MKRRIRRILAVTVLAGMTAMFFTAVGAEGIDTGYTTYECQELAVKNSRQASSDDLLIKTKESALRRAEEDKYKAGPGYSPSQALENKIWIEVKPFRAETELEGAKRAKDDNIRALELDVHKMVMHIVLANEEISLEREKLTLLNEKHRIAKARYDLDVITENELQDIEHSIEIKKNDIERIEDKLKSYDMELKRLMNLTFGGEPLKIRTSLQYMKLRGIDIDGSVKAAVNKSTEVFLREKEFKAMEITMDWTEEYLPEDHYTYIDNSFSLSSAKAEYENAVKNVEVAVRNKYNDLLSLEDEVDMAQKYEDFMKRKVEAFNTKLELGSISGEELLNIREKYLEAIFQRQKAVHDYSIARMEFENFGTSSL